MVEDAITRHVDEDQWAVERGIEAEERRGLRALRLGRNPVRWKSPE
jgi:hypothetical protein